MSSSFLLCKLPGKENRNSKVFVSSQDRLKIVAVGSTPRLIQLHRHTRPICFPLDGAASFFLRSRQKSTSSASLFPCRRCITLNCNIFPSTVPIHPSKRVRVQCPLSVHRATSSVWRERVFHASFLQVLVVWLGSLSFLLFDTS